MGTEHYDIRICGEEGILQCRRHETFLISGKPWQGLT